MADAAPTLRTLSLRDVALETGAIMRMVGRHFGGMPQPDFEDIVSDVRLELLERHARQPAKRVHQPWKAIMFSLQDCVDRRRRRHPTQAIQPLDPTDFDLASPPNQLGFERFVSRWNEETADEREAEARERFSNESNEDRVRRDLWTCRALGTIPAGPGELVAGGLG